MNTNYNYNPRSEVVVAQGDTLKQAFDYDNIGNRIFAKNNDETTLYQTNNLNQYTSISSDSQKSSSSSSSFAPVFDTDGNQTTIKTSTGEWLVEYNGENRPIKFTQGNKVIEMSYDYMGRRVEYISSENDMVNQHAKFVYNDYVLVQELSNANIPLKEFVWDPTAGQATTPLVFKLVENNETFFYTQDANKNIAELVFSDTAKGVATHYEYDSFGNTIIATNSSLSISNTSAENIASLNPFKFSSEYHDSSLGLVYYNYRHYNPNDGRWINRDPIAEEGGYNLYGMVRNNMINFYDTLGLEGYVLGADDPKIKHDEGPKNWNTESPTIGIQILNMVVDIKPMSITLPDAFSHLKHYFGNSGNTYTIRFENMMKDESLLARQYKDDLLEAISFSTTLGVGTHDITSSIPSVLDSKTNNWHYAVGGYNVWGKGVVTITQETNKKCYDLNFEFKFEDMYNWDKGKFVTIAGITVTDEFMRTAYTQGLAREFLMVGSFSEKIRWTRP